MAATIATAFREEVREPQREVAVIQHPVIRADGIVRHDKAALQNINEVRHRIRFQYLEQPVDFERVVESIAVSLQFIAIYLPMNVMIACKS